MISAFFQQKLTCPPGVCRNLTDLSVFELASLPGLRRLSLVRVQKVTDIGVFAIAEQATGLERLHLSYCDNISLDAMHLLLRKLERLQHLTATGIPAFRRKGIQRFSEQIQTVSLVYRIIFSHFSAVQFKPRTVIRINRQHFTSSMGRMLFACDAFWIRKISIGEKPKKETSPLQCAPTISWIFTKGPHSS